MMTRINSQFEKTRKISGPRSLQPSQWGMLCPSDTPEGEACGLVKNLSLTTHVTTEVDTSPLIDLCINLGMEDASLLSADDLHASATYLVLMNGIPIGVHCNPHKFAKSIRILRRHGKINEFVSVFVNKTSRSISVACDSGRLVRPLILVEKGRPLVTETHIRELKLGVRTFNDFI